MNTTIENKERVICQGFQVIRLKERITELKLTFGFYDFAKLKELEDEVIALQGYTPSMEKRLEELKEEVASTIQCMKNKWKYIASSGSVMLSDWEGIPLPFERKSIFGYITP